MLMYNLIKQHDNYVKASGILWTYYRDVAALDDEGAIADFTASMLLICLICK